MFESPVLRRCSTKPTTSFCKEQAILSLIFFSSPAAGVYPVSTFPPSPRLRPFQPRFLVPPCKMISTLRERVEIPKVEDSPRFKYIYTNTNTQIQIHKYKYTYTNTHIQIHKYKFTNTNAQIHKYKYT